MKKYIIEVLPYAGAPDYVGTTGYVETYYDTLEEARAAFKEMFNGDQIERCKLYEVGSCKTIESFIRL